jgi:hypothetical protein
VPLIFAGRGRLDSSAEQIFQFGLKGCEGDGKVDGRGLFGRFVGFGNSGLVWRGRRLLRRQRGSGGFLSKARNRSVGIDCLAAVARFLRRKRAFLDGAPDVYSAGCGLLSRF